MSDMRNKGPELWVITGASGGIGAALASRLMREYPASHFVLHACAHAEKLAELKAEAEAIEGRTGQVMTVTADLTKPAEIRMLFRVADTLGTVDRLVYAAGVSTPKLIQDYSDDEIGETVALNLTGAMLAAREAVKRMVREHRGKILLFSSVWGNVGAAGETVYSATKAGVNGFVKALAREVAYCDIQVNALAPGAVDTPMLRNELSDEDLRKLIADLPSGRLATAEEIADIAAFILGSDADYFTGQVFTPDGGLAML